MAGSYTKNNQWFDTDSYNKIEWGYIRNFLGHYRTVKGRLILAILCAFVSAGLAFLIPVLFTRIQAAFNSDSSEMMLYALGAYLAILLVQSLMSFFITRLRTDIYTELNKNILLGYYKKILNLAVPKFLAFKHNTNLFQRLIDVTSVTGSFTGLVVGTLLNVITMLLFGIVIFQLSWVVGVVVVSGTLLLWASLILPGPLLRRKQQVMLGINYPLVSKMLEIINGLLTIKSFAASVEITRDISELVDRKKSAEFDQEVFRAKLSLMTGAIRNIILIIAVGISFWQVLQGQLTVAEALAIYVIISGFLGPVSELAKYYLNLSVISVNIRNYYEILTLESEVSSLKSMPNASGSENDVLTVSGELEFRNISFGYHDKKPVLEHLNLHIPAGETVALIGKNGAGKTTLVRLLLNFIQPQNGEIHVDGIDINSFSDRQGYRRFFGIVNQNDFLFNISIRDNILFGLNGRFSDQDVYEVLRAVNLFDDIDRLDNKLDTIFQNEIFSGGQRQRLLIARALIRDPRIVILDEPTSALDFENEIEVMNALEKLVQGRTTLIIAHRLSTVKQADRVLVMQDGTIVADGNHFELYDTSKYYRSLCDYNSFIGS